jgi:hypothetical protein
MRGEHEVHRGEHDVNAGEDEEIGVRWRADLGLGARPNGDGPDHRIVNAKIRTS